MSIDKPPPLPVEATERRRPYVRPHLRRLGPLEVITQGAAGGSTLDRRRGSRTKRGRR